MENDLIDVPPQEQPVRATSNPLNVGFGLVVVFALGLSLGFFGRPSIIKDVPIQVVVTVVPNNSETVAQLPIRSAGESANSADTSPANEASSEGSTSQTQTTAQSPPAAGISAEAAGPLAPDQAAQSAAGATPTLMEFIMADARHWQGEETAPITIVEFSDFK